MVTGIAASKSISSHLPTYFRATRLARISTLMLYGVEMCGGVLCVVLRYVEKYTVCYWERDLWYICACVCERCDTIVGMHTALVLRGVEMCGVCGIWCWYDVVYDVDMMYIMLVVCGNMWVVSHTLLSGCIRCWYYVYHVDMMLYTFYLLAQFVSEENRSRILSLTRK